MIDGDAARLSCCMIATELWSGLKACSSVQWTRN